MVVQLKRKLPRWGVRVRAATDPDALAHLERRAWAALDGCTACALQLRYALADGRAPRRCPRHGGDEAPAPAEAVGALACLLGLPLPGARS